MCSAGSVHGCVMATSLDDGLDIRLVESIEHQVTLEQPCA
jgi:hypothetical protein